MLCPLTPLGFLGGSLGYGEVILILFVALIIFGRRLPEVGRSLGQGLLEFKKGLKGVSDDIEPGDGEEKPDSGTSEAPPGAHTGDDSAGDAGELKG